MERMKGTKNEKDKAEKPHSWYLKGIKGKGCWLKLNTELHEPLKNISSTAFSVSISCPYFYKKDTTGDMIALEMMEEYG